MSDYSRFTAELVSAINSQMPPEKGRVFVALKYDDDTRNPPLPPLFDEAVDLHVIIRQFFTPRPQHLVDSRTFEYGESDQTEKNMRTCTLTPEQWEEWITPKT